MTQVVVNGNTYSDSGESAKDMLNGGHVANFFPLISDTLVDLAAKVTAAQTAKTAAELAETTAVAAATTAVSAPGTSATSTTSVTIGTGSKAFTIQTGKSLVVGMSVKVAETATPTNWMFGDITAYNSGTGALTVNVTKTNGSGTIAAWTVSLSGVQGVAGADGGANSVTETSGSANITLTSASAVCQSVAMTALGKHVTLPDATTLIEGGPRFLIRNAGGYPIGVRDSAGTLVAAVAAGGFVNLYLIDNSTAAGVWSYEGTNLEPGLITIDNTFSSTYAATVLKPFVALDDNKSIHFLALASGFAAVAVDKTTGAVGTPLTISATASSVPKHCFKIDTTRAIVFYGEDTITLRAAVITLSGATTLAVGTADSVAQAGLAVEDFSGAPKIAQLSSTSYLVSYATATGAGNTSVIAFSVSGTTITNGGKYDIITSNNVANSTTTYALTATTGLVLYESGAAAPYALNAVVISVSGTTCTVGTPAAIASSDGGGAPSLPSSCLLSATKALVVSDANNTAVNAHAITISGTTVTIGAACTVEALATASAQIEYTANSATRYNPHLSPLSTSTALLWYLDGSGISRAVVLSESGGTVTAGAILYQSISSAGGGTSGAGNMCQQGTSEFIALRQEGAANSWRSYLVPHKVSGTTITQGESSKTLSDVSATVAIGANMTAIQLSSGDYLVAPHTRGRSIHVVRSNGDFIKERGSVSVPTPSGVTSWANIQGVSSSRAIFLQVSEGTTVSSSTRQLRLISVEIAQ